MARVLPPEYLPPVFIPIVTFKDGSIIHAKAGYNPSTNNLWIFPSEPMTFSEAANLFSQSSKTDHIRIDHSAIESEEYDHYTRLDTIKEESQGLLAIRLKHA